MRFTTVVLLFLCIAWYLWENGFKQAHGITAAPSDFMVYYRAAEALRTGHSPFDVQGFDYPPLMAFLVAPLTLMSYVQARCIWFAVSHLFLLGAAWLTWRQLGHGRLAACCVVTVWALGGAAAESLALGQVGPLLLILVTFAYGNRGFGQGAAIGIGAAVKLFPGLLIIASQSRRDWRAVGASLLWAAMLIAIPWLFIVCFLTGASRPPYANYWMGTPAVLNWSLPAVALRAVDRPRPGHALPHNWEYGNVVTDLQMGNSQQLLSVTVAAFTLAMGIVVLQRLQLNHTRLLMAALIPLILAASPICWTHYQVLQYPGLALVLYESLRCRMWKTATAAAVCGAFLYQIPVSVLTAYYHHHGGWTADSPLALYIWTSVTPVASISLFGLFATFRPKAPLSG